MSRAEIERELAAGFRQRGRTGLAGLVGEPDFDLWVQHESGWRPTVVSQPNNQGMVNGGLFQFWYGHQWARPFFSRGNSASSTFTMPPRQQAHAVVDHFPQVTATTVKGYARDIRARRYRGWP